MEKTMRSFWIAAGACAALLNTVPAAAQGDLTRRGGAPEDAQSGILLRFQLIAAAETATVDPAITAIDAVLKDLFRFPGYRLLTQAAVMMERPGPRTLNGRGASYASQLLSSDGETYKLEATIDSATQQTVRLNVSLAIVPRPGSGTAFAAGSNLFSTSVEVSYGHTVVLGNTQPSMTSATARAGTVNQTLILAVRAENRGPASADNRPEGRGTTYIDGVPVGPAGRDYTDAQVDEAVKARSCSAPVYPPDLKAARVSGSVSLRYIVAPEGKAEPGSIKVVSSTNRLFEQPAINAVLTCVFSPAKIKGAPVRQIIEQVVRFVPPPAEIE